MKRPVLLSAVCRQHHIKHISFIRMDSATSTHSYKGEPPYRSPSSADAIPTTKKRRNISRNDGVIELHCHKKCYDLHGKQNGTKIFVKISSITLLIKTSLHFPEIFFIRADDKG